MRLAILRAGAALALAWTGSAATAACELDKLAEFPVTMSGLRPIVTVKINGADARFIADSGAFFSVISPGNATAFGLPLSQAPYGFYMTGIGGGTNVLIATVKKFTLGTVPLNNVQFIVGGSEVGTVGVIGQNVWGVSDVEYDLPHGIIRMMRPRGCGNRALAYWADGRPFSTVAIEDRGKARSHTVGTVSINGHPVEATFDTGAPTSILSLEMAARLGIRPDSPGVVPAGTISGFGRRQVKTWIAPIASLNTNGEEIRNLHMRIGDLGPDLDMLIGADFFIAHRVYVANSQKTMFFTYEGGPVFNVEADYQEANGAGPTRTAPSPSSEPEPTDADGFSRRGAVFAARRDLAHAIEDFGHAITLAPTDPDYLTQRASAYLASGQRAPAADDLDRAIKLKPDNVSALLMRAQMRTTAHDRTAALADARAASAASAKTSNDRLFIGNLFSDNDDQDHAIAEYDLWIAAHPADSRRPEALNDRCWSRALLGRELDRALADCDQALRAQPTNPGHLDSRGLVHLRSGDPDRAIADYNAALAISPHIAWSLYGRGIAKLRKGVKADGEADIAAAVALEPKLPDRAKLYGIVP